MFSIEVVNLSNFALTISEAGFTIDNRMAQKGRRAAVVQPIVIDGKAWPRRLEAREAVSVYFHRPEEVVNIGKPMPERHAARLGMGTVQPCSRSETRGAQRERDDFNGRIAPENARLLTYCLPSLEGPRQVRQFSY